MLPDTLLVAGTDLSTLPGILVEDLSGLLAPGRTRGEDLIIPGLAGALPVGALPFEAYSFDVPITVLPDDASGVTPAGLQAQRAQMRANLAGVVAACSPGTPVTLTRRLTLTSSTSEDHTCTGRLVDGLQMAMLNPANGRTVLQFVNLTGAWLAADLTVVVP